MQFVLVLRTHRLTVEEHIWFYGCLKGLSKTAAEREIAQMVQDTGLTRKKHDLSMNLSGTNTSRDFSVNILGTNTSCASFVLLRCGVITLALCVGVVATDNL